MKLELTVENVGKVSLTDRNYLAAGGEASVYVKDKTAYKIYHDASQMIPADKIEELGKIKAKNVLKPENVARNGSTPVGYTMQYIKTTHPLCKLFTKAFKQKNGISPEDIVGLVKKMQDTVVDIHKAGCLVVDLNEMNFLVSQRFAIPYFIDVDSYQTPSYKATAIMESVRDRQVKNNKFTELSDWFSFAVVTFQLYVGIHPYKGKHPDYKGNEWLKRMDDGVSVFDSNVTLPRTCEDFSIIPEVHRRWFKDVFVKGVRSIPPEVGAVVAIVPTKSTITTGTADFDATLMLSYNEDIVGMYDFMGVKYAVTSKHVYKEEKPMPVDVAGIKLLLCASPDMSPIVCRPLNSDVMNFELANGKEVGRVAARDAMCKNGVVYTVFGSNMVENYFDKLGDRIVHKQAVVANVSELATKVFDGVVFQDLLGKQHATIPYEKGKCVTIPISELNGYRIIDAKAEGNVCAVSAEKRGNYYRFVIVFDKLFRTYGVSRHDDISYEPVNFTVLPNGNCIMTSGPDVMIFNGSKAKTVANPPFDPNTKLFNVGGAVFFVNGGNVYSVKAKK